MATLTTTPPAVAITPIQPQNLHDHWSFAHQGIETVMRKLGRDKIDFLVEDVFAALRNGGATLYLVTRGSRVLGYWIAYVQIRPFSGKKELFLWIAYSIPLRDRLPDDNVPEAVVLSMDYMKQQARALGCDSIVHLSSRRGFQLFGFEPTVTSWRLWL